VKTIRKKFPWQVSLVIVVLFIMSLACSAGNVDPQDTRLPGPINQMLNSSRRFFGELDQIFFGDLQAPWILEPTRLYNAEQTVVLKGKAQYHLNTKLVIYQADPIEGFSKFYKSEKSIASTELDLGTDAWEVSITLPQERQFLVARLERDDGEVSHFSNMIYISKSDLTPLVITTPSNDEIEFGATTSLAGTGDPGLRLEIWVNGQKTTSEAFVNPDSSWQVDNVILLEPAFDTQELITRNKIEVRCPETDQTAAVELRITEPISLLWPFGEGEGSSYKPNSKQGQVSSFFHDDWHYFGRNSTSVHAALDIVSGKNGPEIHAVAAGVISNYGTANDGANYLIVDSGAWGTLYYHLKYSKPENSLKKGDFVNAGDVIAIEGNTGLSSTGSHLHISVRLWDSNSNKASPNEFWVRYDKNGYTKPLDKFINLNPTIADRKIFNDKNIELYDWWGGSPLCEPYACWKDVVWKDVPRNQGDPTDKYAIGCLLNGKWNGGYADSPYATRQWYCKLHPAECKCP